MKKLTRDQMKNVTGGFAKPPEEPCCGGDFFTFEFSVYKHTNDQTCPEGYTLLETTPVSAGGTVLNNVCAGSVTMYRCNDNSPLYGHCAP